MGRIFQTLEEAALEIRRDLSKGPQIAFSRVQQHTQVDVPGRERTSYEYAIMGGIPETSQALVEFGQSHGFAPYLDHPSEMKSWLDLELHNRLFPQVHASEKPTELDNPLLISTIEGNWPSYTYRERMMGAITALEAALEVSLDTRRAFWPIFLPQDAYRAGYPTRVPCSLGYEVMLRQVDDDTKLQIFYLERSCDFDRFWLSDVWFAYQIGRFIAANFGYSMGPVYHYIISFHSFTVDMHEIY